MTDASSAEMFASGLDWLADHRRDYLESGGVRGHILDLTFSGGLPFSPHLLLSYVGRKSGNPAIKLGGKNLLIYGENGSGKSSIFHALDNFFSVSETDLLQRRDLLIGQTNIYSGDGSDRLCQRDCTCWPAG